MKSLSKVVWRKHELREEKMTEKILLCFNVPILQSFSLRVKRGEGKAINSQAKENENVSLVFLFICLCRTHKPILSLINTLSW